MLLKKSLLSSAVVLALLGNAAAHSAPAHQPWMNRALPAVERATLALAVMAPEEKHRLVRYPLRIGNSEIRWAVSKSFALAALTWDAMPARPCDLGGIWCAANAWEPVRASRDQIEFDHAEREDWNRTDLDGFAGSTATEESKS
jgi:hypothetical protein